MEVKSVKIDKKEQSQPHSDNKLVVWKYEPAGNRTCDFEGKWDQVAEYITTVPMNMVAIIIIENKCRVIVIFTEYIIRVSGLECFIFK